MAPNMGRVYNTRRRHDPICQCGKPGTLSGYPARERSALQELSGLTGETRDGLQVVQALLLSRRLEPPQRGPLGEEVGEEQWAAFICPFGPAPGRVVVHGWGSGTDPRNGARLARCKNPRAPEKYFLHVVDVQLPCRTIRRRQVRAS